MKIYTFLFLVIAIFSACENGRNNEENVETATEESTQSNTDTTESLSYPNEKHLKNIRQLTFGGDNAEAYFSFDDQKLVFQRTGEQYGLSCDQIFYANIPKNAEEELLAKPISNGLGRTTCAYFMPGDSQIIYASTYLTDEACPENKHMKDARKYVWPIFDSYEIFIADLDGNQISQLTDNEFYDAEATVSPKGDRIVFTSNRSGDLELYTMKLDGSDVVQVTSELGYDGGAFFSPDGTKLVYRSSRPKSPEAVKTYTDLLAQGLVAPSDMEIYVCNVDGSNIQQITNLGNANWAPFFHPSGEKIIFCSNHTAERGFPFNLYIINVDGTGLEKITEDDMFDSFPMFTSDGKQLVFSSNRNNGGSRDTNMFIADWED